MRTTDERVELMRDLIADHGVVTLLQDMEAALSSIVAVEGSRKKDQRDLVPLVELLESLRHAIRTDFAAFV